MRKEVTIILLAAAALIPATYAQSLCYTCTNCPTVGNLAPTSCPIGTAGCFRREEADGTVTRGCVSALSATEAQTCQAGNLQSGACRTCPDNLCNAKADFQRCHRCDNTGQNCAQLQNPTDNTYVCQNYMDSCGIVMVQERTVRGCVGEINFPQTCNALTCESCADNFCNSYIFPNNRLRCNRCSGTTDQCFNAITGTDLSRVCDNYVQSNDQCYTSVNENQQVNRGCRSDDGTGHASCPGPNCESCFQSNCNSIAARWNPTLSCVACAATDVACNWGYSETDATACTSTVFLGQTESCFQRDLADGTSVRGCSLDSATNSVCAETDANCMMCTRSGCNRLSHRSHSCYQCRSSNDDRCRNEVKEELEPASCLGNTQTLADRGCYTLTQDNGHVVRGCLRYLDANLMAECRAGDRCDICDTDNCNHEPSGAAAVKISLLLVAMVGVVMKMFV